MRIPALAVALLVACSSSTPEPLTPVDASAPDAAIDAVATDTTIDASAPDASAPDAPPDAALDAAPEAAVDATEDDAGFALTLSYTPTDCAQVEAVSANDGGIRQNEICDRGRAASARYATVRACAEALTTDAALVGRVADEGAYMNPSRHPDRDIKCSRFTTLYPVEQVQRALWCLRHADRCNDDGSPR